MHFDLKNTLFLSFSLIPFFLIFGPAVPEIIIFLIIIFFLKENFSYEKIKKYIDKIFIFFSIFFIYIFLISFVNFFNNSIDLITLIKSFLLIRFTFFYISIKLNEADGFVFVVPEWGGMVPSQVKNIFLLASNNEFAHKPGLIVTLSESLGGSYPVVELRSFSYKNTKICWIPDHVIIRKVKEFDPDKDLRLNSRLDYSCKMLLEYSKALVCVRNAADLKTFKNGM